MLRRGHNCAFSAVYSFSVPLLVRPHSPFQTLPWLSRAHHTEQLPCFVADLPIQTLFCSILTLSMQPIPPVTILGTEYPALADGKYDAIILGTGLKECIVAGLLATEGKKVWCMEPC